MQTETVKPSISLVVRDWQEDHLELTRLMAAAVVNREFCRQLLEDPGMALACGYQGESFLFTEEERNLILSIRAETLSDLAQQLVRTFFSERVPPGLQRPVQTAELLEV